MEIIFYHESLTIDSKPSKYLWDTYNLLPGYKISTIRAQKNNIKNFNSKLLVYFKQFS